METNVVGVLTEALTANVEVVLADQGSTVSADAADVASQMGALHLTMVAVVPKHTTDGSLCRTCGGESSKRSSGPCLLLH